MMMEVTAERRYMGVRCHSCGEAIAVPNRIAKKTAPPDAEGSENAHEINPAVFNLRCKVCEKENFYGAKDMMEMHGEPRLTRARAQAAGSLLRPSVKLVRTANA
jgi:cytochrome c5